MAPATFRRRPFDVPHEAEVALRLQWQGRTKPLVDALPSPERAVVVSPFASDFVRHVLEPRDAAHRQHSRASTRSRRATA
jgi:hypothetical protein